MTLIFASISAFPPSLFHAPPVQKARRARAGAQNQRIGLARRRQPDALAVFHQRAKVEMCIRDRDSYPHKLVFPAAVICLIVLCFNLIADGLRDALDPRLRR